MANQEVVSLPINNFVFSCLEPASNCRSHTHARESKNSTRHGHMPRIHYWIEKAKKSLLSFWRCIPYTCFIHCLFISSVLLLTQSISTSAFISLLSRQSLRSNGAGHNCSWYYPIPSSANGLLQHIYFPNPTYHLKPFSFCSYLLVLSIFYILTLLIRLHTYVSDCSFCLLFTFLSVLSVP